MCLTYLSCILGTYTHMLVYRTYELPVYDLTTVCYIPKPTKPTIPTLHALLTLDTYHTNFDHTYHTYHT